MMAESRWIKTSLFLMLVLQFTAALSGQLSISLLVREGHDVTLPCNNVREGQHECDSTTWLAIKTSSRTSIQLIRDGQLDEQANDKSDRLSVTHNCSLVIKKVNEEDVGYYECRQSRAGQQQGQDARVYLSVVTMTEHNNTDEVTLHCYVMTYDRKHNVKWLFQGRDIDKDNNDVRTSQSDCSSSVTFLRSNYIYASRRQLLTCKVTEGDTGQLFPINHPQLSGEATITTTESTATNSTETDVWWLYIIVAVVLLAVLIITVAVVRWKSRKGNMQNDNVKLSPATCAPETSQDMADPEDSVCYTSIVYTKETNSKAWVQRKNDTESDAVTYSTVKASSADPTSLYTTIN